MSIFHFKMVQHQLKVYGSLIKAEVEPSLNLQTTIFTVVKQDKLAQAKKSA